MGLQRVGCDWVTELNWKPNLHQKKKKKKVMVTVWWYEPVWFAAAFWIPVKPLHLRSMLSKSLRCTENCNARHWHLLTRKSLIFHDNVWAHVAQPTLQKLNELGYKVLPYPTYSPDFLATHYHFFKHLDNVLQGKCFHSQQEAENAFQEFLEPQIFMLQE